MNKKFIAVAWIVFAALLIVLTMQLQETREAQFEPIPSDQREPFRNISLESVEKIRIERTSGEFNLVRKELEGRKYFAIAEQSDYPADGVQIENLLYSLGNITLLRKIKSSDKALQDCDLSADRAVTITLFDTEGKTLAQIMLGKQAGTSGRFLCLQNRDTILITRQMIEIPSQEELANLDFPPIRREDIQSVIFSFPREQGPTYTMGRAQGKGVLTFSQDEVETKELHKIPLFPHKITLKLLGLTQEEAGLDNPVQRVEYSLQKDCSLIFSIGNVAPWQETDIKRQRYISIDFKMGKSISDEELKQRFIDWEIRSGQHVFLCEDSAEFSLMNLKAPVLGGHDCTAAEELNLTRKDDSISLCQKGSDWILANGYDFYADQERIRSILEDLSKMKVRPGDIANSDIDPASYEAKEGNTEITVKTGEDKITLIRAKAREQRRAGARFTEKDFVSVESLATKLRDANSEDPLSLYLREHISERVRRYFYAFDTSNPFSAESQKVLDVLQRDLAVELDSLTDSGDLYDETRFKNVKISPEAQALLEKNPQNDDLRRLNRFLLEDAYSMELSQSKDYFADDVTDSIDKWGNYYIKPSGALTFSSDTISFFEMEPEFWLHKDLIRWEEKDIAQVEWQIPGEEEQILTWHQQDKDLVLAKSPEGFGKIESESLITALGNLSIASVVKTDDQETIQAFEAQPDKLRLAVTNKEGILLSLTLKDLNSQGHQLGIVTASYSPIQPSSADESTQEPADESTQEPADESTQEPADESTQEPADESTQEPADESTQEPADESTQEPADESTQEPADESTQEPADESTQEPADESTQEPADENTQEPADESTQEPADESTQEPADESTQESGDKDEETPIPSEEIQAKIDQINQIFEGCILKFDFETARKLFVLPLPGRDYEESKLTSITIESGEKALISVNRTDHGWKFGEKYAKLDKVQDLLKSLEQLKLRYGHDTQAGSADTMTLKIASDEKTDIYKLGEPFSQKGSYSSYRFLEFQGKRYLIGNNDLTIETDNEKWQDPRLIRFQTKDLTSFQAEFPARQIQHEFIVEEGKLKLADLSKNHVMRGVLDSKLNDLLAKLTIDALVDPSEESQMINTLTLVPQSGGQILLNFSEPKDGKVWAAIRAKGTLDAKSLSSLAEKKVMHLNSEQFEEFGQKREELETIQIQTSHILVSWAGCERSTATRTKEEAKARIEEVKQKLEEGQDFAELAKEYSDEPGADETGGKLSIPITQDTQTLDLRYRDAALQIENVGDRSDIVESAFGFHIIRRDQ